MKRGNFETWNLNIKSFTLTDGGYDLLLLPKSDKASIRSGNLKYERIKPNQFQIVAQRLKSPIFRMIFNFNFISFYIYKMHSRERLLKWPLFSKITIIWGPNDRYISSK